MGLHSTYFSLLDENVVSELRCAIRVKYTLFLGLSSTIKIM